MTHPTDPSQQPPRLATYLLEAVLSADGLEPSLGDLEECFRETRARKGPWAARIEYWKEALSIAWAERHRAPGTLSTEGDGFVTRVLTDLRFARRLLVRRPAFTALVVATLALGIGATTAIFSAVYPILLDALPYPEAERIVVLWERDLEGQESNTSFATYVDIAQENHSFEAVSALRDWQPTAMGKDEPEQLTGQRVSFSYFRVLGVSPALGRGFLEEEDTRTAARTVVLSYGLWRRRFGGDSTLIGRPITLDGLPYLVVGVMPSGFQDLLQPKAQLWAPLAYDASLPWACRTCRHLRAIGRIRPDVTLKQASGDLNRLSEGLFKTYPTEYPAAGMILVRLRELLTRSVRTALFATFGSVLLVLLIACANVANLLLGRATQRAGEFAIRGALGAGRGAVIRQLLTESLLLALVGGIAGLGVATLGVQALRAFGPANLPRLDAIRLSLPTLAFAMGITTMAGIAFGLVPAIHAARRVLHDTLKAGSHRAGGPAHRTRGALVVAEIALALMLLVGAGLLLKSSIRILSVDPGFDSTRLLTMQIQTAGPRYREDSATRTFFGQALESVRQVPGVESASLVSQMPLSGDFDMYGVHSERHPRANPEEDPSAHRYAVRGDYVGTMRIPLLRGRGLTEEDGADHPAVALISEAFARRAWPGQDPLGDRVRMGDAASGPWVTIVGIVGNVKQVSLAADETNAIYIPEEQWSFADGAMTLVVRTSGAAATAVPALRQAIWSVDKNVPIVRVATMEALVAASTAERRFVLILFEAFATVALILAAAGIYGVLTGQVTERLREIGIRTALGASRRDIVTMVLRQGLGFTAAGVGIGAGGAVLLSRTISALLFGVSPADPLTYGAVTLILVLVALVACWSPAWRASRVDPVVMLRAD